MSEDSKKPGGEADDLLSKLFDSDEPVKASSEDAFSKPTRVTDEISEHTEFSKIESSPLEDSNDKTEFIPINPSAAKQQDTLDALLGLDSTPESKKAPPVKMDLGDNLFDKILDEEPLADEKINFFSTSNVEEKSPVASSEPKLEPFEQTVVSHPEAENPFGNEGGKENTILLNEPEVPQAADAIDDALSQFAESGKLDTDSIKKAKSGPKAAPEVKPAQPKLELEAIEEVSDTIEPSSEAKELSSDDFADVFSQGPIQVAEATVKTKSAWGEKFRRHLAKAASFLIVMSLIGGAFVKLRSDAGILGIRLDGWTFTKGYIPPTEEEKKSFLAIFTDSQMARTLDDPKKLEDAIAGLEGILIKDERNVEAAASILENQAILINWFGVSSSWSQKYDQSLQRLEGIYSKLEKRPSVEAADRADAWRLMAVGDYEKAYKNLSGKLSTFPNPEDSTYGILAELSSKLKNEKDVEKWLQKITKKVSPRIRLVQALALVDHRADLQKVADEGYLPAKVAVFVTQEINKNSTDAQIENSEKLLESVKNYPVLALQVHSFRGDLYAFRSQSEKARAEWKSIVEKYPKDASLWLKLASSYEEDALWDDAVSAYKSAQSAGAHDESLVVRLAHLLHVRGKIVEAIALLDQAITTQPTSAALMVQKGRVQLSIYQEDAAKGSFEKALTLKPGTDDAILGLAEIAIRTKDLAEAESQFKKITEKSVHFAEALKGLASIAEMKHDLNKARNLYAQALKVDPKLETVYPHLVNIYLVDERDDNALEVVEKGLDILPRSPHLKVALARIHQFQQNYEKALRDLESVKKAYGHLAEVSFAMADVLIDNKETAEAWKFISPLVEKELRDSELQFLQAKAYYESSENSHSVGSNEAAYRLIESAVHREPENIKYRILAAQLAFRLQDKPAAFEHIDAVLRYNSNVAKAYMVRGDIQMDNGEYSKATSSYQEAMKYTRFRSPIYHRLAESFKALGKSSLAIQFYRKVTGERPTDAEPFLELGKLYNEDGRFQAAMECFKKALSLNPKIAEAYYFLGFIQKDMGDKKGAIQSFEKFLSLEPSGTESATIRDEVYFLKNEN